jgi:lipoprotein-releasing system permease protein
MLGLALRYLLARRRQTLLMLLGITAGTASFITLSGLLVGFKDYLVDQMVNNAAALRIEAPEDGAALADPGAWSRRLDADPRVASYAPQLEAAAVFSRGGRSAASGVIGCDPRRQGNVTTIAAYVTEGRFLELSAAPRRIAIGVELQKKLGAALGTSMTLIPAGGKPVEFKVAAVFKTGVQQADLGAYARLEDIQNASGRGKDVSAIAVRLKDYTLASAIAREWSAFSKDRVRSWDQMNANLMATFKAEDWVRFLAIGAVLLVAAFGIYNVLNMMVVQKRKDIAILRSMGFGFADVVGLFLAQGLLLGAVGAGLGALAGWGAGVYLRTVSIGGNPMGAGTGKLAVTLDGAMFLEAAGFALVAVVAATVIPAMAAGRLNPIEVIRSGAD